MHACKQIFLPRSGLGIKPGVLHRLYPHAASRQKTQKKWQNDKFFCPGHATASFFMDFLSSIFA